MTPDPARALAAVERKPEVYCCCGRPYSAHFVANLGSYYPDCQVFTPRPPEGHDAPIHVCDHGYQARSCGLCERDGRFR